VQGGSVSKASCPAFKQTVTKTTSYTKISKVQRLQQLAEAFGDTQGTQTYKLAASLMYAGQAKLDTGGTSTNTWSSNVNGGAVCQASWLPM
jgi:hypothetical protein